MKKTNFENLQSVCELEEPEISNITSDTINFIPHITEINIPDDIKPNKKTEHYVGHRKRMKEKLINSKPGSFADYELLEMLLFYSHPRIDVKPLAKELIKSCGNLHKVFNADPKKLMSIKGIGESTIASIKLIKEIIGYLGKEEISTKPIIESWSGLLQYAKNTMGHLTVEQFRVLYLDKKYMLISDDLQETGTVDHTPVYPREIIKKALYLDAYAIILIHNHPSGNTKPSKSDINATNEINKLCQNLGLKLIDHLIIGNNSHYSFKNNNLI